MQQLTPRRKHLTLSQLAIILYEDFIPDTHHKYLYRNYRMLPTYRKYNDFVLIYLHGHPRQVIIHCLDRRSNSQKFCDEDILSRDTSAGLFTLQSSSTIDFGLKSGKPSCTCADWVKWNIPCKHFFAIFRLVDGWGWESLPDVYKRSPYLCDDSSAVLGYLGSSVPHSGLSESTPDSGLSESTPDSGPGETDNYRCIEEIMSTTELSVKNVRPADTFVRYSH